MGTAPTTAPASTGQMWAEAGDVYYMTDAGDKTAFAPVPQSKMTPAAGLEILVACSAYVSDFFEIASGTVFDIGVGAVFEMG